MEFLKRFFTSCLGAFVALIIFSFIGFFVLVAIIGGLSAEKEVVVSDNSILRLQLDARISEQQVDDPLEGLIGSDIKNVGLLQLKEAIHHAKEDAKIKGIYLELSQPITFYSSLAEIRASLDDFKESGKWIVAYSTVFSEGAYYLSSVADEIYLNPEGELEFNGITAQFVSFKKMLDKLEIQPQVFRVGEFKSAVEPFLLEKMSDENRTQLSEMINTIYGSLVEEVAESRGLSASELMELSDNMTIRTPEDAVRYGLIDSLVYKDQFDQVLMNKVGVSKVDDLKFVSYTKYKKSYSGYSSSKNEIAVIVADGTIMPGSSENIEGTIGADTFVEEIRKARENDKIKAVVLRINSPGGEFRSSDMIWREVELTAQVKPIIASMGDYAASGGYYIAMACDTIVAQPMTVTGSIGIFGVMFDFSRFLDNKIGIKFEEVKTGNYGEMYTVTRPLNDAEKRFWQRNLDDHYRTFIQKVAAGRNMDTTEVLKIAAGRVWTGTHAKENGLVDVLGGFEDAVAIAAEKAGVADDYRVRYYPKKKPFLEQLLTQLEENAKVRAMKSELGENYYWYDRARNIQQYQGSQARLPFQFTLE